MAMLQGRTHGVSSFFSLTRTTYYRIFCIDRNNRRCSMADLSPVARKFILHWGEMGARWGINRTVAQGHALLFISEKPLNAEEITALLSVARSNVSTTLKELQRWCIVRVVHVLPPRRDPF